MFAVLIALNILAALFLIGVVLLQSGKGADMGAAFGGASSTVFGTSGAGNLLTKLTAGSAAVFMLTSLALAVSSTRQHSVFDTTPASPSSAAPAAAPAGGEGQAGPSTATDTFKVGGDAETETEKAAGSVPPVAATGEPASDSKDLGPAGQAGAAPSTAAGTPQNPAATPPANDPPGGAAKQ